MPDKIDEASKAIEEFTRTKGIDSMERAVDALEEFDIWSIKPEQRLAERRRLILTWSRDLRALDSVIDPSFDPNSNPTSRYPPPPAGYPSGVTPKSIPDPRVRARYEAAIAENEKKRANRRTQQLARALQDRSTRAAQKAVERLYTSSAADQKELDSAFDEAGLSPAHRKELRTPPPKG